MPSRVRVLARICLAGTTFSSSDSRILSRKEPTRPGLSRYCNESAGVATGGAVLPPGSEAVAAVGSAPGLVAAGSAVGPLAGVKGAVAAPGEEAVVREESGEEQAASNAAASKHPVCQEKRGNATIDKQYASGRRRVDGNTSWSEVAGSQARQPLPAGCVPLPDS